MMDHCQGRCQGRCEALRTHDTEPCRGFPDWLLSLAFGRGRGRRLLVPIQRARSWASPPNTCNGENRTDHPRGPSACWRPIRVHAAHMLLGLAYRAGVDCQNLDAKADCSKALEPRSGSFSVLFCGPLLTWLGAMSTRAYRKAQDPTELGLKQALATAFSFVSLAG